VRLVAGGLTVDGGTTSTSQMPNRHKAALPTPSRPEIALRTCAGRLSSEPAAKRRLIDTQNSGKMIGKTLYSGNVG